MVDEEYLEAVLDLVATIPPGRVMTYGTVAEEVGRELRRGGPRQVGRVMSMAGGGVPWWRVIRASGLPATCHEGQAAALLSAEGCPLRTAGQVPRVVLPDALWWPDDGGG